MVLVGDEWEIEVLGESGCCHPLLSVEPLPPDFKLWLFRRLEGLCV